MNRPVPFVKMHGAANDFVMLAGAALADAGLRLDRARIAALCDRRARIGGDGLIVVAADPDADFR